MLPYTKGVVQNLLGKSQAAAKEVVNVAKANPKTTAVILGTGVAANQYLNTPPAAPTKAPSIGPVASVPTATPNPPALAAATPVAAAPVAAKSTWFNADTNKYETSAIPAGLKEVGVAKGGIPSLSSGAAPANLKPIDPALAKRYAQIKASVADKSTQAEARKAYAKRALATPGGADMLRIQDAEAARMSAARAKLSRLPSELATELERDPLLSKGATDVFSDLKKKRAYTAQDRLAEAAFQRRMYAQGTAQYKRNQEKLKRINQYGSGSL